jgi:4-aminobutyrate aminotransferase
MIAVEFAFPLQPTLDRTVKGTPRSLPMKFKLVQRCIEKGLLLLPTSGYETVRFIPPLNISRADLAKGMDIFKEAVKEVVEEA